MDKKIYNVTLTITSSILADSPEKAKEIAIKNLREFVPMSQVLETIVTSKVEEDKNGCRFVIDLKNILGKDNEF